MNSSYQRPGASQDVAIGVASAQASNAISPGIVLVRLCSTIACYVAFGANPTATKPGSARLAPNFPETWGIVPGQKVAVIQDTGAGTLTITEMSP